MQHNRQTTHTQQTEQKDKTNSSKMYRPSQLWNRWSYAIQIWCRPTD